MSVNFPSFGGLKAFYAVVETGGIRPAAELLGISASGVSHQVKRLERELNVKLLEVTGSSLAPTLRGEAYFRDLRPAMRTILDATGRLTEADGEHRLTLSVGPSFAASWLLPKMKAFNDVHPEIELNLIVNPRLNDLARDRIDLAVRRGKGNWEGLVSELILPEQYFPVMAPGYQSGAGGVSMRDVLASARLISNTSVPDEWGEWCRSHGLDEPAANSMFSLTSFELTMQAALDGLGIALGRRPLVDGLLDAGALIAPFGTVQDGDSGYYVAWRRNVDLTVPMRKTIAWFRAQSRVGRDDNMSTSTDKESIDDSPPEA